MMAMISLRSRKVFKEKIAYDTAEKDFPKLAKDPFFMLGMGLGGIEQGIRNRSSFQFTTDNPEIAELMLSWIEKYLFVPRKTLKYRLFVSNSHKDQEYGQFWAKKLRISDNSFQKPVYLKTKKDEKDKEYKGSISFVISKIEVVRRIIAWQKLTIGYYS